MKAIIISISFFLVGFWAHSEGLESQNVVTQVIGSVNHPRTLEIKEETNAYEILQLCGGPSRLWGRYVYITRSESDILRVTYYYRLGKYRTKEDLEAVLKTIIIKPGDHIDFHEIIC
jgi:hypothetical protein